MNIDKNKIKRILLINLKYLGDLIVCSPAYRVLKSNYPDSEITIITRKGFKHIFDSDKNIDKVIEFDLAAERRLQGIECIKSSIRFMKYLRKQRFDLVITFHPTDRIALWSFFTGAKYRIGYKDQSFSFLFNIKVSSIEESKSYLEYYLDTLRSINLTIDNKTTYIEINSDNEVKAEKYFRKNFDNNDVVVGIHPGASRLDKIWGSEKYALLTDKLKIRGIKTLFFSGPDDSEIINSIRYNLNSDEIFIEDTSENVLYLSALMKRCSLIVCNDSASSHIARALNKKTITLMSREKKHCWQIYDEKQGHYFIFGDICPECIGKQCKENKCLKNISCNRVLDQIMECLNA